MTQELNGGEPKLMESRKWNDIERAREAINLIILDLITESIN